jgi:pyrroline-5-carboxylate reductase
VKQIRITIIGGGHMGRALLAALLRQGTSAGNLVIGEAQDAVRESLLRDYGVRATADNLAAIEGADAVLLAVKPQEMARVVTPLRAALSRARPLVLSVAAGIRCADLQDWCGDGVDVVRAMPNRPALVSAGATGLYAAPGVTPANRELATRIMESTGVVVWVPDEAQIDIVTALSGSGPAYFFLLGEAMAEAGRALGLDPATATRLAAATLHGAGLLAAEAAASGTSATLARMRGEVTSKGGTTEAAIAAFEQAGLREAVLRAMTAATQRGQQLAAEFRSAQPPGK